MLTALLGIALIGQASTAERLPHAPKMPISFFQLPVLGGQREIIMGPQLHEEEYDGFFVQRPTAWAKGNALPPTKINYEEERVGWMDWSVANYEYEKKPALLLQTEGLYRQVMSDRWYGDLNLENRSKRSYWLSPDGKILQENSVITTTSGIWLMQATFHADSYDLFLRDPEKGSRRSTVFPACGIDKLNAMFTPMVKEGKVVVEEKEFYQLDPITGGPVKFTAKAGGVWSGKWFNGTNYKGRYYDIDCKGFHQRAFLTEDGALMKVEVPNNHYLNVETKPNSSPYPKKG